MSVVLSSLCIGVLALQAPSTSFASFRQSLPPRSSAAEPESWGVVSSLADARLESRTNQPGGRSTVIYLLDESELQPVTEATPEPPGRANALEAWIVDRVTQTAPRLDYVRIQHSEESQLTSTGSTRKSKTWLEFAGLDPDVDRACACIAALVVANRKHVAIDGMFVTLGGSLDRDFGVHVRTLAEGELDDARRGMLASKDANVLTQPSIVTGGGQRATVSIINQVSYVADFEIDVNGDSAVVDPEIKVVQEGLLLDLCPIIDTDGQTIHLIPRLEVDTLQRPIREFETEIGGIAELTIQVPFVEKVRWEPAPIDLRPPHVALLMSNLRVGTYDAESNDGERTERAMSLLLHLRVQDPAVDEGLQDDGVIGWFDPEQSLGAATLTRTALRELQMDEPLEIRTVNGVVPATLIGWLNDTLFIRVDRPVSVGDHVRFVRRETFSPR